MKSIHIPSSYRCTQLIRISKILTHTAQPTEITSKKNVKRSKLLRERRSLMKDTAILYYQFIPSTISFQTILKHATITSALTKNSNMFGRHKAKERLKEETKRGTITRSYPSVARTRLLPPSRGGTRAEPLERSTDNGCSPCAMPSELQSNTRVPLYCGTPR